MAIKIENEGQLRALAAIIIKDLMIEMEWGLSPIECMVATIAVRRALSATSGIKETEDFDSSNGSTELALMEACVYAERNH